MGRERKATTDQDIKTDLGKKSAKKILGKSHVANV